MINRLAQWAEQEFGLAERIAATLLAGLVFVILIPVILLSASPALDRRLGLPDFQIGALTSVGGGFLTLVGFAFALWPIVVQLQVGRGTPLPIMATQLLLTAPPFSYCRNPMSLGTIGMYFGLSIWVGSPAAVGVVLLFFVVLLTYLKLVEERELEARFGEAYRQYKDRTPFLIPGL